MQGVFVAPRISPSTDANALRQFERTTAFGTAGVLIIGKAGRLYQLRVVNTSATRYYLQIHDKATAPLATEVPKYVADLPASGERLIDFGLSGYAFTAGMGIAISSTAGTLTFALATDAGFANALYAATTA